MFILTLVLVLIVFYWLLKIVNSGSQVEKVIYFVPIVLAV